MILSGRVTCENLSILNILENLSRLLYNIKLRTTTTTTTRVRVRVRVRIALIYKLKYNSSFFYLLQLKSKWEKKGIFPFATQKARVAQRA